MLVRMALTDAEQIDRLLLKIAGTLRRSHDDRRAAVADQRTIEQMERIGDQRELSTSSTVIGLRICAAGFIEACLRQATATAARCASVVP